jgi:nucleoside-triphosphatase
MLRKRVLLLMGSPGVGKTTVLLKIVEALKVNGYTVGGMISREVRSDGSRVGFEIMDLIGNKTGWLAHVEQERGPQVGKYRVNMEELDGVGVNAVLQAIALSDAVVIDEIGPMELFSDKFKSTVREAAESTKLVVGIVHWKARSKLIDDIKSREDAEMYVVTFDNREKVGDAVTQEALGFLKTTGE